MDNVINLNDRRSGGEPETEPGMTVGEREEAMGELIDGYAELALNDMPLNILLSYAREGFFRELAQLSFEEGFKRIEEEYPDFACKFKSKLLK
jgi:hypothetical protein